MAWCRELETGSFFYRLRPRRRFPRDATARRRAQLFRESKSVVLAS